MIAKQCLNCKRIFLTLREEAKYCTRTCSNRLAAKMPRTRISPERRFWRNVRKSRGCWEYGGSGRVDYRTIHLDTRDPSSGVGAHRFSWELHFGPIPEGIYVCHKCDNPKCVRPNHLFLGTNEENQRDSYSKGRSRLQRGGIRHPVGEAHHAHKLTAEQVKEIRRAYAGKNGQLLAEQYGVRRVTINRIVRRMIWTHI